MTFGTLQIMNYSNGVQATTTQPSMMLWNDTTKEYLNPTGYKSDQTEWQGSKLYWGKDNENPLLWRILSTNDSEYGTKDGMSVPSVLIQGEDHFGWTIFGTNSTYEGSILASFIDNKYADSLTSQEKDATLDSTKEKEDYIVSTSTPYTDDFKEKKWVAPTAKMMGTPAYGYPNSISADPIRSYFDESELAAYWLASRDTTGKRMVGTIRSNGIRLYHSATTSKQARAASSLNPDAILLVSNAEGGKVSGSEKNALTPVSGSASGTYKLTVKDADQTVTDAKIVAIDAVNVATIQYSKTGLGTSLSAIVTDSAGNNIISYGCIANGIDGNKENQEATIDLPANFFTNGYKLSVFTEYYGMGNTESKDKQSDYASEFYPVGVSVPVTNIDIAAKDDIVSVAVDNTLKMSAAVTPNNATYKEVIWSIENTTRATSIASISEEGLLTGNGEGRVRVTAAAKDGSGVLATMLVNVIERGSIVLPGNIVIKPSTDGTVPILNADGTVTVPEGGKVEYPSGNKVETPNGGIVNPDGSLILMDGTTYDKQGNKVEKPTVEENTSGNKSDAIDPNVNVNTINTGDSGIVVVYIFGAMISLAAILFVYKKRKTVK